MSYPPPPGLRSSISSSTPPTAPTHSSLPPRPPQAFHPSNSLGPSVFSSAPGTQGFTTSANHVGNSIPPGSRGLAFQPRSVTAQSQLSRSHRPTVSAAPAPPSRFTASQLSQTAEADHTQSAAHYHHSGNHPDTYATMPQPQIQNPFPLPGQLGTSQNVGHGQDAVDPELEAQIAQWQSAYASKDSHSSGSNRTFSSNKWAEGSASSTGANSAALGSRPDTRGSGYPTISTSGSANPGSAVAEVVTGADGKQKTVVRQGGGQTWQDPSLLEWDPAHFRLFVGNLAGEVTDDSLLKAFSKYPSVQKARVVRDKRTTKSKGYGFVSFADGDEYFQSAREMQGKYIGSHPVLLRKSTTEIRPTVPKNLHKGTKRGKGGINTGNAGPSNGQGVSKKQSKARNGLKILG